VKVVALSLPLAWLALLSWVSAYEIGIIAGLLSFIGAVGIFLIARHRSLRHEWMLAVFGALATPIAVVGVLSAWEAAFPPPPCEGEDCVQITIQIAPRQ
jgi:hypothetical protein